MIFYLKLNYFLSLKNNNIFVLIWFKIMVILVIIMEQYILLMMGILIGISVVTIRINSNNNNITKLQMTSYCDFKTKNIV